MSTISRDSWKVMFVVETSNAQETGMITPVVNTVEYP